jgi:hypothetical protein
VRSECSVTRELANHTVKLLMKSVFLLKKIRLSYKIFIQAYFKRRGDKLEVRLGVKVNVNSLTHHTDFSSAFCWRKRVPGYHVCNRTGVCKETSFTGKVRTPPLSALTVFYLT